MLSPENRLTQPQSFRDTVRRGRRSSSRALVLHVLPSRSSGCPRAGLIVSRAVGGSVERNLVKRRLRHLIRERIGEWEPGLRVVVRALPPAGVTSSACLGDELDGLLARCLPSAGADRSSDRT